jgi:hypothetical protein
LEHRNRSANGSSTSNIYRPTNGIFFKKVIDPRIDSTEHFDILLEHKREDFLARHTLNNGKKIARRNSA